jgi:hypothetical protein
MKYILLTLTIFGFIQTSHAADCYDSVLAEYEALLEEGSYALDGFSTVSRREAATKINESTEVENKQTALHVVNSSENALFLGYSSQYGGSAEEILVVNKLSCKIIDRIYTYVE